MIKKYCDLTMKLNTNVPMCFKLHFFYVYSKGTRYQNIHLSANICTKINRDAKATEICNN